MYSLQYLFTDHRIRDPSVRRLRSPKPLRLLSGSATALYTEASLIANPVRAPWSFGILSCSAGRPSADGRKLFGARQGVCAHRNEVDGRRVCDGM